VPGADDLTNQIAKQIAIELQRILQSLRTFVSIAALERWIEVRNLDAAMRSIPVQRFAAALARTANRLLPLARSLGWDAALQELSTEIEVGPITVKFGAFLRENPDVAQAIARQDFSRIVGIADTTQEAMRDALQRGMVIGTPPQQLAREIRTMIGLTPQQTLRLERYRAQLVAEDRDPAQVERMVTKLRDRQLKIRSGVIAQTETMHAQNEGRRLQWQRLSDEGAIDEGTFVREWIGSHLESECPFCLNFEGQRAEIGGLFIGKDGATSAGPILHPRCRCVERLVARGSPVRTSARDQILAGLERLTNALR